MNPKLVTESNSLREVFGKELVKLAREGKMFYVLDADVAGGTGVHHFRDAYPELFIQCGIAEQNMMGVAAGIQSATQLPVIVTGFAAFLLRAYEQARLCVAHDNRNIKIVASHPGLDAGPDGGSAQSLEDLACWRALAGMTVISPCDEIEMREATRAILEIDTPVYMRTGRSECEKIPPRNESTPPRRGFEIGKGEILRSGYGVALVACGVMVAKAMKAAETLEDSGISACVVNMSTIKPIDHELVSYLSDHVHTIVTIEDHSIYGGLGGAICEVLSTFPTQCTVMRLGMQQFGMSAEPKVLYEAFNYTPKDIVKTVMRALCGYYP